MIVHGIKSLVSNFPYISVSLRIFHSCKSNFLSGKSATGYIKALPQQKSYTGENQKYSPTLYYTLPERHKRDVVAL